MVDGAALAGERVLAVHRNRATPTGIKVDADGRVCTCRRPRGVQVFSPTGEPLGEIAAARRRELRLRRPDGDVLFITDRHRGLGRRTSKRKEPDPWPSSAPAGSSTTPAPTPCIAAAEEVADARGHRVVIAVVDPSGEVVAAAPHATGAQIASSRVAVDKARTAAIFVRPSREMEEQVTDGRLGALALHGAAVPDRRHPAQGRRRGRRRDRHERRDARRGRGDLDRRRRGRVLDRGGRRADLRGRAARGRGRRRRGRRARRRAGGLRRRRRRRADLPRAARRRPGGERRGHDRQGAHGGDLPPAEQGLRGPGLRRPPVGAAPRARGAAAGRHADRARRRGRSARSGSAARRRPTRTRSSPSIGARSIAAAHRGPRWRSWPDGRPRPLTLRGPPARPAGAAARPAGRDRRPADRRRAPRSSAASGATRDARVDEIDFVEVGLAPSDPLGPGTSPTGPTTSCRTPRPPTSTTRAGRRSRRPTRCGGSRNGRVCFNWYRLDGHASPSGSATSTRPARPSSSRSSIDDYAEVWVNGELPLALGDTGGQVVGGFNAPNRVVLTRDARPGERFQIAVFGINGPISASPRNYIWMRTATLDFYARERAASAEPRRSSSSASTAARRRSSRRRAPRAGGRRLRVHRGPGVDAATARCSSARRTRTRSTAGRRAARSPCSAPRAATPASTSAATTSRARTG